MRIDDRPEELPATATGPPLRTRVARVCIGHYRRLAGRALGRDAMIACACRRYQKLSRPRVLATPDDATTRKPPQAFSLAWQQRLHSIRKDVSGAWALSVPTMVRPIPLCPGIVEISARALPDLCAAPAPPSYACMIHFPPVLPWLSCRPLCVRGTAGCRPAAPCAAFPAMPRS